MAICGLVITLDARRADGAAVELGAQARAQGLALTLGPIGGPRVPAVLETPADDDAAALRRSCDALLALPGVAHVDLAYAHYDHHDAETR